MFAENLTVEMFLHHHSLANNNLKDAVIQKIADILFTDCSTLDLVKWVNINHEMWFWKKIAFSFIYWRVLYLPCTHSLDQNNTSMRAVEYLIEKISTCSKIRDIHVEYVWAH